MLTNLELLQTLREVLTSMRGNPIYDYLVTGTDSHLIGRENGCVRLFDQRRHALELVAPHSHRYRALCLVVSGVVNETVWTESEDSSDDQFVVYSQTYQGSPGNYELTRVKTARFSPTTTTHVAGDLYELPYGEIHSIQFSKGTQVLVFEGPTVSPSSTVLKPLAYSE